MEYIMPCIYAFIACLGFAITYNIRWQRMIPVCFGGALGWVVYLLLKDFGDVFAYFVGKYLGKHKFSKISPKKSVEGSIAGSLMGTAIASLYYINIIGDYKVIFVIIMTLVLTVLGQIGDLFYSKIKRENDIKDFSNIMPGHGGILDRLDSFSFIVLGYILMTALISLF